MNRRTLFLLTFIAALVAITTWLSQRSTAPERGPSAAAQALPDYYIEGIEATVTDSSGRPSHQFVAESLTHYPAGETTQLKQPTITVFGSDSQRWQASAATGTMYTLSQELLLQGAVRFESNGPQLLALTTDWLRIDARQHFAQTDAPVVLQSPSARIEGVGMRAFGDQQRLLLNASVRGNYAID